MPTGACGINCDVCRLNLKGICSTCGPATGGEAAAKLAAQQRILGQPCPVLACARLNHIDHCMRDCPQFPCEIFETGPYPFSKGYLTMQKRRRDESPKAYAADGSHLVVAEEYWQAAERRDATTVCNLTLFDPVEAGRYRFRFLNREMEIDLPRRCLKRIDAEKGPETIDDPLLTMVSVLYIKNVRQLFPVGQDIVGPKELKEGHFFAGPHEFRIAPLVQRFGEDREGFIRVCENLGGHRMDMADAAFRLHPFPRLALYFLLWTADAEFKPRMQVLFDRPIETILAADAIWALVNRVASAFA
jgi:hypothetical protein